MSTTTRWFCLAPVNSGSHAPESLTSYLIRLAAAHGFCTWGFLVREFAQFYPHQSLVSERGHCDLFGSAAATLNGVGNTARRVVEFVNPLVGRQDLESLTLLPFAEVIAARCSVRKIAKWCPECFSDWSKDRKVLHEPLLWYLNLVKSCHLHQTKLESACPKCGKAHFVLERHSYPGFCPRCGGWLGDRRKLTTPTDSDLQIACQCAALLSRAITTHKRPSSEALRTNLRQILCMNFNNSISAFARASGMHHSSMVDLLDGDSIPGLDSLFGLSSASGVPPAILVFDSIQSSFPSQQTTAVELPRRTCQKYDWTAIRRELQVAGRNRMDTRSLAAICREQNVDSGYVAAKLPNECSKIIRKFSSNSALRRRKRERFELKNLKCAVRRCLEAKVWPSHRRLKGLLSCPGSLRRPAIEQARLNLISGEMHRLGINNWRQFEGRGVRF